MLNRQQLRRRKQKNLGGGKFNIVIDDKCRNDKPVYEYSINLDKNLHSLMKEFDKEDICILTIRDVCRRIAVDNKRFPLLSIDKEEITGDEIGKVNIKEMLLVAVSSIERRYRILGVGKDYIMEDIMDIFVDINKDFIDIVETAYDKNQTFGELFITIGKCLKDKYKFTRKHLVAYFRIFDVELEFNDEKKLG